MVMRFNIGIDLGTTNSAMAVFDDESETVEMIENYNGEYTTPSVVQILEDDVIVGEDALGNQLRYPERTLSRTKQYMSDQDKAWEIDGTEYTPRRIAGYILQKLKTDAEDRYDQEVDGAVVTVPYYFGSGARTATKNAAEHHADLPVYRTMNEPTAACYAYGYEEGDEETLLVYDLGGGTFDATIVEVSEESVEAKTSNGDDKLGGENFDDKLYEHVRQELLDMGVDDPDEDRHNKVELRKKVKEAKELLSSSDDAAVTYKSDGFHEVEITCEEFQELTADLVERTINIIDEMFNESEYESDDIDNVLLVGGSTRMPHVQEDVEDRFEMEPSKDTNPDEIVAKGAALEASLYDPEKEHEELPSMGIKDVLSHSLGVETHNDDGPNKFDPILKKDSELPDENTKPYGNPDDVEQTLIVNVLQGEGTHATDDDIESLGEFHLEDVPPDTKLEVEFFIKQDGTLEASAEAVNKEDKDIGGGIKITEGIGLTEKELDQEREETQEFTSKAIESQAD